MFKKKNYKLFIGFIVGIILSATGVYAATYYGTASDLSYDNTTSGLSSTNIQDALDELYNTATCPEGHVCDTLALGDYVSYTPTVTSFTTDTSKTNYTKTQTIYPSELNLWRVLNINEDGTIDLISDSVSSTDVIFRGLLGYLNLIGYLNELASQYETEGITVGSRHYGYNGQTEYITDTSKFTGDEPPWTCSTGGSCDNPPVESQGGGDTLYTKDMDQVYDVLGTAEAANSSVTKDYWIAVRRYSSSSSGYTLRGGYHSYTLQAFSTSFSKDNELYIYSNSSYNERSDSNALRPIVTLKSGLTYGDGIGTKYSPFKIIIG